MLRCRDAEELDGDAYTLQRVCRGLEDGRRLKYVE